MTRFCLTVFFAYIGLSIKAQELHVQLQNENNELIAGATLLAKTTDGTKILGHSISDKLGMFRLNLTNGKSLLLEIRHLEYETLTVFIDSIRQTTDIMNIVMKRRIQTLKEIVIQRQLPILVRKDTIVYNADSYMGPDVRKVEDLLGKLQGFSISPDGRLSFNGRAVEKVLIDGEDLTGNAYQLITKNLGANYIDKIEVVNDYSENRLLRQNQQSGKVGVNLTIKKKFIDRISTNAELAYSAERRYQAEANGFQFASRMKLFTFLNSNNTAQDVLGNAASYYEMEVGLENPADLSEGNNILAVGQISVPVVNDRYKKDNKDFSAALMNGWKAGKYTKLRSLVAYSKREVNTAANSDVQTFLDSNNQWRVSNNMKGQLSGPNTFIKLAAVRDQGNAIVAEYNLNVKIANGDERFANNAGYDLTDSLREILIRNKFSVQTGMKITFQRRNNGLLLWNTRISISKGIEELSSKSGRYASYFGLDNSYSNVSQHLDILSVSAATSTSWLKKQDRWSYRYGMDLRFDKIEMQGLTTLSNTISDSEYVRRREILVAQMNGFVRGTYKWSRRSDLAVSLSGGPQQIKRIEGIYTYPGYEMGINYSIRVSSLRSFKASAGSNFRAINPMFDIPAPLITGNANIQGDLKFQGPEIENSLQASYHVFQVHRQLNWSASLSLHTSPRKYVNSIQTTPEYTLSYHEQMPGNLSGFFIFRIEKYLKVIKGKTGISLGVSDIVNRFTLNDVLEQARNSAMQADCWWISGFSKGPGFETRMRVGWNRSGKENLMEAVWRAGWSQKIHWQIDKKLFSSLIWTGVQLGFRKYFHGLDFFLQRKIGNNWTTFIRGNNMLNVRKIGEKMVQPYSVSYTDFWLVGRYVLFGINFQQ